MKNIQCLQGQWVLTITDIQRIAIALVSFVASAYIALMPMMEGYEYLFLLPLSYGVLTAFLPVVWTFQKGHIGMIIFNVVMIIRFVVAPVTRAMTNDYGRLLSEAPTATGVSTGIWLMLFEIIVSFMLIQIFAKKIYGPIRPSKPLQYIGSRTLLIFTVLFAAGILVTFPSLLNKYHLFVINNEIEKFQTDIPLVGFLFIIVELARIIIPLIIINELKHKYDRKPLARYVIWSFIAILPNALIFTNTSRFSVIVPALALMIILSKMYSKYSKRIFVSTMVVLGITFICITLYKQFGITAKGGTTEPITPQLISHNLDIYFSGPFNMGLSIDMSTRYDELFNGHTLMNDLLYSVAFVGQFVDSNHISPIIFNRYIYGVDNWVDQIIPMTGQGYIYFGFAFSPVFLIISLLLMMKFDSKATYDSRPEFVYVYSYLAIFMSMAMMLNIVILYPLLTNFLVPLLIIFKLNRATLRTQKLKMYQSSL